MYYFDSASARKPKTSCLEVMLRAHQDHWSSPASSHHAGQLLLKQLHLAYVELAHFLQASPQDTITFGSSVQELITQVIHATYLDQTRVNGKNHYLSTCLDEAPIILNLEKLSQFGCSHDLVAASNSGMIDLQALQESIHPRTVMIALSWANALTGVIQPVESIAAIAKERGLLLLLDASPTVGVYDLNLNELKPDFVCMSGNAVGAPVGSAFLWYKSIHKVNSLIPCGHEWMHSTCSNPPALLALARACQEAKCERDADVWKLAGLRARFELRLKSQIDGCQILFESSERLVHVSAVAFEGINAELLAWHLNRMHLYMTFGGGMRQQLHYLLKACYVPAAIHHSCLSFSFDPTMSLEHIDESVEIIASTCKLLRQMHRFKTPAIGQL